MKVYQIIADTYMESYGSSIVSFGIFKKNEEAPASSSHSDYKVTHFYATVQHCAATEGAAICFCCKDLYIFNYFTLYLAFAV